MAKPKPFCGYGAFRLIMTAGVAHVIGPMGKRSEELTAWAREQLVPEAEEPTGAGVRRPLPGHDPFAGTRRVIAAMDAIRELLDAINWIHPTWPGVVSDLLDPKPKKTRELILLWLRMRGCTIKGRGRGRGRIVVPRTADDQAIVGLTITRFRQLFEFWNAAGIRVGHNPMQMDPDDSRLGTSKKVIMRVGLRWWLDVDGMFRTRVIGRQAPRPHDPAVAIKILERGLEMGWPEEVYLKFQGMYLTGSRMGQMDAATAYGLLVEAKDDRHVALIQKGSNGTLAWQALTPRVWRTAVLRMVARRVPGGVKTLMRWAKSGSDIDHARLRKIYLFSPDGRAPTPAWRSAHLLRLAVESLGYSYRISRDDGTIVTKWFTSHWFRHVFVNRMLDRIAASSAIETVRDTAKEKFADYMGWSHPKAMLAYYGRHHDQQESDLLVMQHQDDLDGEVMAEFEGEGWWVGANDNSIIELGRVVGGDLLD